MLNELLVVEKSLQDEAIIDFHCWRHNQKMTGANSVSISRQKKAGFSHSHNKPSDTSIVKPTRLVREAYSTGYLGSISEQLGYGTSTQ